MKFDDWAAKVPDDIRGDSLWKVEAYRLALFLSDLAWIDGAKLLKDRRSGFITDQLCRAVGKISSCIAEGYSRGTGKARGTFYEYALGSTREARDWYYKSRHILKDKVSTHRIQLCTQLIRLLIRMTSNERRTNRRLSHDSSSKTSITTHQSPPLDARAQIQPIKYP